MKYTEKEKRAIENIKDEFYINGLGARYTELKSEDLEILLSLLEKQQKEIEKLKYKYKKYGKVLFTEDAIKENYVSKNEIREKIKTFKNIPNYGIFESKEPIIRVLKEILGE